ncbi:MAG: CPBP family intramembrane metalloprotease, partial [Endomicrobiales bacterium]|nr:CPBP family intramembrane metalloprotease [Endomicrobiales bacterium]
MFTKKRTIKLISVITLMAFVYSAVLYEPLMAINVMVKDSKAKNDLEEKLNSAILPYNLGRIVKSSYTNPDYLIIYIQDLHCHSEVQKNIYKTLQFFDKKFKVNRIFVEGAAAGKVDTRLLRAIPDEKLKKDSLDILLDKGLISGAEYYAAIDSQDKLYGIEEREIYNENLKRINLLFNNREANESITNELNDKISQLKQKHLSKKIRKLEKLLFNTELKKKKTKKYYLQLEKIARKAGNSILEYPNLAKYIEVIKLKSDINYKRLPDELKQYNQEIKRTAPYGIYKILTDKLNTGNKIEEYYYGLYEVSRKYTPNLSSRYPNLAKFLDYIHLNYNLNPIDLIKEEEVFIQNSLNELSNRILDKELLFLSRMGSITANMVKVELPCAQFEFFNKNKNRFEVLLQKYFKNNDIKEALTLLEQEIICNYYEANLRRNDIFVENIVNHTSPYSSPFRGDVGRGFNLAKNTSEPTVPAGRQEGSPYEKQINLKNFQTIDIVIAGGFHTDIVSKFKQKGISYLVVTPNITKQVDDSLYQEVITGNIDLSRFSTSALAPPFGWLIGKSEDEVLKDDKFMVLCTALAAAAQSDNYPIEKLQSIVASFEIEGLTITADETNLTWILQLGNKQVLISKLKTNKISIETNVTESQPELSQPTSQDSSKPGILMTLDTTKRIEDMKIFGIKWFAGLVNAYERYSKNGTVTIRLFIAAVFIAPLMRFEGNIILSIFLNARDAWDGTQDLMELFEVFSQEFLEAHMTTPTLTADQWQLTGGMKSILGTMAKVAELTAKRPGFSRVAIILTNFICHAFFNARSLLSKPSLHWDYAEETPWDELVKFPNLQVDSSVQLTKFERKNNSANYETNSRPVRLKWLEILKKMQNGDMDFAVFEKELQQLNKLLILGVDGKTPYVPPTLKIKDIEKLSDEEIIQILNSIAGKFESAYLKHSRLFVNDGYKLLEDFITTPLKEGYTLQQVIYNIFKIYQNINHHIFIRGNQSLIMNLINALLRLHGLRGIPHTIDLATSADDFFREIRFRNTDVDFFVPRSPKTGKPILMAQSDIAKDIAKQPKQLAGLDQKRLTEQVVQSIGFLSGTLDYLNTIEDKEVRYSAIAEYYNQLLEAGIDRQILMELIIKEALLPAQRIEDIEKRMKSLRNIAGTIASLYRNAEPQDRQRALAVLTADYRDVMMASLPRSFLMYNRREKLTDFYAKTIEGFVECLGIMYQDASLEEKYEVLAMLSKIEKDVIRTVRKLPYSFQMILLNVYKTKALLMQNVQDKKFAFDIIMEQALKPASKIKNDFIRGDVTVEILCSLAYLYQDTTPSKRKQVLSLIKEYAFLTEEEPMKGDQYRETSVINAHKAIMILYQHAPEAEKRFAQSVIQNELIKQAQTSYSYALGHMYGGIAVLYQHSEDRKQALSTIITESLQPSQEMIEHEKFRVQAVEDITGALGVLFKGSSHEERMLVLDVIETQLIPIAYTTQSEERKAKILICIANALATIYHNADPAEVDIVMRTIEQKLLAVTSKFKYSGNETQLKIYIELTPLFQVIPNSHDTISALRNKLFKLQDKNYQVPAVLAANRAYVHTIPTMAFDSMESGRLSENTFGRDHTPLVFMGSLMSSEQLQVLVQSSRLSLQNILYVLIGFYQVHSLSDTLASIPEHTEKMRFNPASQLYAPLLPNIKGLAAIQLARAMAVDQRTIDSILPGLERGMDSNRAQGLAVEISQNTQRHRTESSIISSRRKQQQQRIEEGFNTLNDRWKELQQTRWPDKEYKGYDDDLFEWSEHLFLQVEQDVLRARNGSKQLVYLASAGKDKDVAWLMRILEHLIPDPVERSEWSIIIAITNVDPIGLSFAKSHIEDAKDGGLPVQGYYFLMDFFDNDQAEAMEQLIDHCGLAGCLDGFLHNIGGVPTKTEIVRYLHMARRWSHTGAWFQTDRIEYMHYFPGYESDNKAPACYVYKAVEWDDKTCDWEAYDKTVAELYMSQIRLYDPKMYSQASLLEPLAQASGFAQKHPGLHKAYTALFAPPVEETVFRGGLMTGMLLVLAPLISALSGLVVAGLVNIIVFSASHVIIKWLVERKKTEGERTYTGKDAIKDFFYFLIPSTLFILVYSITTITVFPIAPLAAPFIGILASTIVHIIWNTSYLHRSNLIDVLPGWLSWIVPSRAADLTDTTIQAKLYTQRVEDNRTWQQEHLGETLAEPRIVNTEQELDKLIEWGN